MNTFLDYAGAKAQHDEVLKEYVPLYKNYVTRAAQLYELQVKSWIELLVEKYGVEVDVFTPLTKIAGKDDFSRASDLVDALERNGVKPTKVMVDTVTGELTLIA